MLTLHNFLFSAHVLFGSMALVLFWIPVFSRKGSLDHRRFGRFYSQVMYLVAATGAAMAMLVLFVPLSIKGHLLSNTVNQETFVANLRQFWSFLLYLSLITFISVRHGIASLKCKQSTAPLRRPGYVLPIVIVLFSALTLVLAGLYQTRWLFIIFGGLGLAITLSMLRYVARQKVAPSQWLQEHLGAMIGSGIGAHTAFLAFGGRHLFEGLGQWQLLFWIAPGVIGGIAISIISRKYAAPRAPGLSELQE